MEREDESSSILEYPPQRTDDDPEANTNVVGNFIRMESIKAKHIHVYVVDIRNMDAVTTADPSTDDDAGKVKDPSVRKHAFEQAVIHNYSMLGSNRLVFDGGDYAYGAKAVHKKWSDPSTLTVNITHSDTSRVACLMHVTLHTQRRYDTRDLVDKYCAGDRSVSETYVQGMLYALDNMVRSVELGDMVQVGGRQLCGKNAVLLGKKDLGVDLFWEYKYTMRPGSGGLFVNIGHRMVPVINKKTVVSLAHAYFAHTPRGTLDAKEWREFEPVAQNLRIGVMGATHNRSTYRVVGISKEPAHQLSVNGIPLASYYRDHFGITNPVFDDKLPCLLTADEGPPIPVELGTIDEVQVLKPLARWQRTHILTLGYLAPTVRHRVLAQGAQALANGTGPALDIFGIRISPDLVTIGTQLLAQPQLLGSGNTPIPITSGSGKWEIGRVVDGRRLESWAVLVLGCNKQLMPVPLVHAFVSQLVKVGQDLGIDVRNTSPPIKYAATASGIEQTLAETDGLARGASNGGTTQIVLCILPCHSVRLYGELKRVALTVLGVQTQCVVAGHVKAHTPKLLSMVALKINVKLGGTSVALSANDSVERLNDYVPTLVISADVSHTTESQCMSVAAILGSLDLQAMRFQGTVLQHPKRMEFIENFDIIVRQSVRLFYRSTGCKPQRILYYRDGVNDSQIRGVKDLELRDIYKGCKLIDPAYKPLVTVVMARKRHNTRFIVPGTTGEFSNCLAGTLVSRDVSSPTIPSFYLCAHQPELGVSRPTCYYILHDDSNMAPHVLRSLTYNMCYTYPIISRSATMPAALYYAHRLSGKGRLQLNRRFDDLPYFTKENDKKAKKKVEPMHLVPVHMNIQDSMYFM
ncbi:hypothetical protein EV175_004417 [Coemansia sp. RSA 1933]|nr:hypothetical protein EV175_004417 [Coemansia sp. RSA 1933]